jgi:hypothetical protein
MRIGKRQKKIVMQAYRSGNEGVFVRGADVAAARALEASGFGFLAGAWEFYRLSPSERLLIRLGLEQGK